MLTIGRLGHGPGAADYYLDRQAGCELDYYTGGGEPRGVWCGSGAVGMGLPRVLDGSGETALRHLLAGCDARGETLVEMAGARLTDVLLASWPAVARDDAKLIGESLVRLAISYAALPKAGAAETAEGIASLLGPYVEQLVADATAGAARP